MSQLTNVAVLIQLIVNHNKGRTGVTSFVDIQDNFIAVIGEGCTLTKVYTRFADERLQISLDMNGRPDWWYSAEDELLIFAQKFEEHYINHASKGVCYGS